ncbi:MAG: hypothetical protein ACKVP2_13630 [Burkholderiales bacterium]
MQIHARKRTRQHWIVKFLPLESVNNAADLISRLQEEGGFRAYVLDRRQLVLPAAIALVLISIVLAAASFVFFSEAHVVFALLALFLAPIILVGSFLVQGCIFLYWLDNRALMQALGNRAKHKPGMLAAWLKQKFDVDMGTFPRVPWVFATLFLILPMAMLVYVQWEVGLILLGLAILLPIVFARFDR